MADVLHHSLMQETIGVVNAMRYAATPDAHNSATLAAALAAIGSTPTTLMLEPATWTLTSTVVIPAHCVLKIPPGTLLNLGSGVTLTLGSAVESDDPMQQRFTGTGTVVHTAPRVPVLPQWWGAVGDGVTTDLSAIRAAFAASRLVHFPAGTYALGAAAGGEKLIDLSAYGGGITITTAGQVRLVCTTTSNIPYIFYLENNPDFQCGPLELQDLGYDSSVTWKGAWGFYLLNPGGAHNWGNLHWTSLKGINLVGPLAIVQSAPLSYVNRIRSLTIDTLISSDCYYGFNCQNDGDGVFIGNLEAYRNYRPMLVYGCSGITVARLYNIFNRPTSGMVNIARLNGGLDTSDIRINYIGRQSTDDAGISPHLLINHIDLLGGAIRDITVNQDIINDGSTNYYPAKIVNYTGSGGSETTVASLNYVADVHLSGTCDAKAYRIPTVATFANKRQMTFATGLNYFPDVTTLDAFQLTQQARGDAELFWGATVSGTNSIGDGTLVYDLDVTHGMLALNLHLQIGASTTFGTGAWYFTSFTASGYLFTCKATTVGQWMAIDSSGGGIGDVYTGTCLCPAGAISLQCYGTGLQGIGATVPFAWAVGDTLQLSIWLPVSG